MECFASSMLTLLEAAERRGRGGGRLSPEGVAEGAPLPPVAGSFALGPGRRQPQQGKGRVVGG